MLWIYLNRYLLDPTNKSEDPEMQAEASLAKTDFYCCAYDYW